jgi:hypothetical protein
MVFFLAGIVSDFVLEGGVRIKKTGSFTFLINNLRNKNIKTLEREGSCGKKSC